MFILKGGYVMIPLAVCSVIALTIIIERLIYLGKLSSSTTGFMSEIHAFIKDNKVVDAISYCSRRNSPVLNIIKIGLENNSLARNEKRELMEVGAGQEIRRLENFLPGLATIANISPILGLLGTVTGMIKAFNVMAIKGTGNPAALAGGISEALITTATGLIIAIPALIMYNYFSSKVNSIIVDIETNMTVFLDISSRKSGSASLKDNWEKV